MAQTPKNLARHELIGLDVEVVKSTDPSMVGIKGCVRDETQNMLTIETETGEKRIEKTGSVFRFFLRDGAVDVEGNVLAEKPHERTKNMRKK